MTTIDRQRGRDATWQVEALDALARMVDILHDISDGVRELSVRVDERRAPREQTPPQRDRAPLLTVEDLAEKLGLSVNAIRALRARRRGPPAMMVGSRVFFQPDDVDAWLSANRDVVEASMASWRATYARGRVGSSFPPSTDPSSNCIGSNSEPFAVSRYPGRGVCRVCRSDVVINKNGRLRKHGSY